MRVSLIVWVKRSLTWFNVLNFTLYNYFRQSGSLFQCNQTRIMGEPGSTYEDYLLIQGNTMDDVARRMQFFGSCRITVNTLSKNANTGNWEFAQNNVTEETAGSCSEAAVTDCSSQFSEAMIQVSTDLSECTFSGWPALQARYYTLSLLSFGCLLVRCCSSSLSPFCYTTVSLFSYHLTFVSLFSCHVTPLSLFSCHATFLLPFSLVM